MLKITSQVATLGAESAIYDSLVMRVILLCCSVQAVFFGAVALTTLRMKFFWTPYMCIIASISLASRSLWAWLLSKLSCRSDFAVCTSEFLS